MTVIGSLAAHGVGGPADLPVPLLYSIVGATWALTLSFVVLIFAWREPRFSAEPDVLKDRRPWLAAVGIGLTVWLAAVLFGSADTESGLRVVYIYVWVGLVPLALICGHVWRDLSPWRTIQAGREPVQDGVLVASWDTSTLAPGDYLLRLVVTNAAGDLLPDCQVPITILISQE